MEQSPKQSLSESQVDCGTGPATGEKFCRNKLNETICIRCNGKDWKRTRFFELDHITQVPFYSKGLEAPRRTQVLNSLLPTDLWGLLHVICHHDVTVGPWLCPSVQIRQSFIICCCCERNDTCTGR